jgi:galactokinase
LISSAYPDREFFWMSEFHRNPANPWADFVKGVLDRLRRRGVHFSGFNAAIHSELPMGAGLGSSTALTVATALAIRQLYPFSLTETGATLPPRRNARGELPPVGGPERLHFAKVCQAAEADFVGARTGLLDPLSSLFGRAWHALSVDLRFLTVEPAPMIGEVLILCDTGVRPESDGALSDELRQNCESAARKLRARSLRSIEMKYLRANRESLTAREFECSEHVVGEIQRVVFGERALRADDHRQFGEFLFQSHESTRDLLKNSSPELDLLVGLARAHPGCLGARRAGGGATVNLVAHHQAEAFMKHIALAYERRTGQPLRTLVCLIADGAN